MSNITTQSIMSALNLNDSEENVKACQKAINGSVSKLIGKYLTANKSKTEEDLDYTIALNQAKLRMRVAKATLTDRIESRYAEQLALAQRKASASTAEKQLLGVKEPSAEHARPAPKKAKKAKNSTPTVTAVEAPVDPIIATIQ